DRPVGLHPVEVLVVDRQHRRVVAGGQALGVLQREPAVGGGLVVPDAEMLLERLERLVTAEPAAHGVGAHADQPVPGRAALVHGVEAGHPGDLRPGQAEHLGAEGDALRRDVPLLRLHQVQQRQQRRTLPPLRVPGDDLAGALADALVEHGVAGRVRHRSQPPITGSSEAPPAIRSATRPPSATAGSACRLMKLGSRKWTRYGRVPPSETACTPSSPRGLSICTYTWPGGTRNPSVTSLKWWISASID